MFVFLIVLHTIVCLVLILVILLQAGRGSGLGGFMGGGAAQTFFGTRAGDFFTKATTVCAILFLITCLSLGVITSRRSRSLLEGRAPVPVVGFTPGELFEEEIPSADLDITEAPVPGSAGGLIPMETEDGLEGAPPAPFFPDVEPSGE